MQRAVADVTADHHVLRVLLVDDDESLRTLLRITFEEEGVEVVEACDGETALVAMSECPPDCIVLDWRMPGLDGAAVLGRMSRNLRTSTIPVVVVSACPETLVAIDELPIRPQHWIAKPFSPVDLVERLREVLGIPAARAESDAAERYTCGAPTQPDRESRSAPVSQFEATMTAEQIRLYVRDLHNALEREQQRVVELEDARHKLERLDRTKTEFLDFISHELRTPLQQMSVITFLDEDMGAGDHEMLAILRLGYDRLCRFVDEGLCYVDALAQEENVENRVVVDLVDSLKSAFPDCDEIVMPDESNVRAVSVSVEPGFVAAAIGRIQRFVDGIIGTGSSPTIGVRSCTAIACVEIAIPEPVLSRAEIDDIRSPFHRRWSLDSGGGGGLDLPIAHELIRRQGGTLTVRWVDVGEPLLILLTLPLATPEEAAALVRQHERHKSSTCYAAGDACRPTCPLDHRTTDRETESVA